MSLTNGEVRAALQESIKIWEQRAAGNPQRAVSCPLCVLGQRRITNACDVCPIKAYTGERSCFGTPYYRAARTRFAAKESKVELNFLKRVERHYFGPGSELRVRNQVNLGGTRRGNK